MCYNKCSPFFCSLPSQVSVYQVRHVSRKNSTQDRKLLSSRLIPIHSSGWEVFTITQAVSVQNNNLY